MSGSGNLRLFVLAYAATLVIGGVLLFLFLQLRSGDGGDTQVGADPSTATISVETDGDG